MACSKMVRAPGGGGGGGEHLSIFTLNGPIIWHTGPMQIYMDG